MIINKEEVEEFIKNLLTGDFEDIHIDYGARKGVEFAEEKFKDLAIEFTRHIRSNPKEVEDYMLTIFEEGKFVSNDVKHYDNIEELFETFIKERNEKN